jgi:hypothetical protein
MIMPEWKQLGLFTKQEVNYKCANILNQCDDTTKKQILRELMVEQLHDLIHKWPIDFQQEVTVILVDLLMQEWKNIRTHTELNKRR